MIKTIELYSLNTYSLNGCIVWYANVLNKADLKIYKEIRGRSPPFPSKSLFDLGLMLLNLL